MKKRNWSEVLLLRNNLQKLMLILQKIPWKERPYFYHFLEYMKNNIEICLYTQDENMEFLEKILYRDWKAANMRNTEIYLGGLQRENRKEEIDWYRNYYKLLEEIELFFQ